MAKQMLLKLTCDYCKASVTLPTDRQLSLDEAKEAEAWIEMRVGDKLFQYDRTTCALNGLRVTGAEGAGVIVAEGQA